MEIIIANPICINMMQQALMTIAHATMMVIHEKTQSYIYQTPSNDFIPPLIKTYESLHSHFD
jgi:hypothetical protein